MNDQAEKIAGELIKQGENAWNAADGQAFGEPYTEDAVFVTIRGDYLQSRAAIMEVHQSIFNTIYKDSRITCVLLQARPDLAGGRLPPPYTRFKIHPA